MTRPSECLGTIVTAVTTAVRAGWLTAVMDPGGTAGEMELTPTTSDLLQLCFLQFHRIVWSSVQYSTNTVPQDGVETSRVPPQRPHPAVCMAARWTPRMDGLTSTC